MNELSENARFKAVEGHDVTPGSDGFVIHDAPNDKVHELNSTAAVVYAMCDGQKTVSEIRDFLCDAYGIDEPPDLDDLFRTLETSGLVYRTETVERCPVCGAEHGRDYPPDLRRCDDCRVYFQSLRPTWEAIHRFYDEGQTFALWENEQQVRDMLWAKRLGAIRTRRPYGRLLDIGAGDGHFLGVAAEAGYDAYGTEISRAGVARAGRRGVHVFHGLPEDLPDDAAPYDVVTLWHVLEHSLEPGDLLGWIRARLRPGGLLAVAVPNATGAAIRTQIRGGGREHCFERPDLTGEVHLTHFEPASLRTALRRSGFDILGTYVDDVYVERGLSDMADFWAGRALCRLTGGNWFASRAMVCLATVP